MSCLVEQAGLFQGASFCSVTFLKPALHMFIHSPGSHAPHENPSWMRCIHFKVNRQSDSIGQ